MLDDALYVPVLRWKAAEKNALQGLHKEDKSRLKPLLEIIPPAFQAKNNGRSRSVRDVLRTCWSTTKFRTDHTPISRHYAICFHSYRSGAVSLS